MTRAAVPRATYHPAGRSRVAATRPACSTARTRPIVVRRPSPSIVSGHPWLSQSGLNLRNLYIRNGRPFCPRRSCENRIGLPLSIQIASATISMMARERTPRRQHTEYRAPRRKLDYACRKRWPGEAGPGCLACVMRLPPPGAPRPVRPQANSRRVRRVSIIRG